jgi:hypothetical protein
MRSSQVRSARQHAAVLLVQSVEAQSLVGSCGAPPNAKQSSVGHSEQLWLSKQHATGIDSQPNVSQSVPGAWGRPPTLKQGIGDRLAHDPSAKQHAAATAPHSVVAQMLFRA